MRRRISPDNPVKRCLFPSTGDDEQNDEGRNDNSINGTKEILKLELKNKIKKWHYDFENDVPLTGEGNVNWEYQNENGDWIGKIQNDDETDEMENKTVENEPKDEQDEVEDIRMQNEVTPNPTPVKEATPPPVRKRSRDDDDDDDDPTKISAKRKIL